ncbi:flavin reductase family protein [Aspergillus undulatus]|uniref:flavin reductase family protein n=1 Tax=Aspergillus undulatus TaxID=1810928 RepID=UPI003CCC9FB5
MFYEPGVTEHGLPHDPFKACVIPRPIGWISTRSPTGTANLAPYSQFNNLTFDPPYVMFSANQTATNTRKDTVVNAESTGHFAWNLATYPLREAVNISAEQVPYGVDEFERANLTKEYGSLIDVPMVKESPVKFECTYHSTIRLPGHPPMGTVDVIIGRVVGVHIANWALNDDGILDVRKTEPIARCGYYQYAVVRETFDMVIPGMSEDTLYGLEGSSRMNRERHLRDKEGEKKDDGEGGEGGHTASAS